MLNIVTLTVGIEPAPLAGRVTPIIEVVISNYYIGMVLTL